MLASTLHTGDSSGGQTKTVDAQPTSYWHPSYPKEDLFQASRWFPAAFTVIQRTDTNWLNESPNAICLSFCVVNVSTVVNADSRLQWLNAIQATGLHTSIEKSAAAVTATLDEAYLLDKIGQSRTAARSIMVFIEKKLRTHALSDANKLLAEADVSSLSTRSLIGLVRSTYRVNGQLPAWAKLYRASWKRARELGKQPEALFVGLPKVVEEPVAPTFK